MKLKILWLRWRTNRLARQERALERAIARLGFRLDAAIRDKSCFETRLAKAEMAQDLTGQS